MGNWGAFIGGAAGAGAGILDDKIKFDRKAKQEAAVFERNKALEDLRLNNQYARQDAQIKQRRDWQLEDKATAQDFALSEEKRKRGVQVTQDAEDFQTGLTQAGQAAAAKLDIDHNLWLERNPDATPEQIAAHKKAQTSADTRMDPIEVGKLELATQKQNAVLAAEFRDINIEEKKEGLIRAIESGQLKAGSGLDDYFNLWKKKAKGTHKQQPGQAPVAGPEAPDALDTLTPARQQKVAELTNEFLELGSREDQGAAVDFLEQLHTVDPNVADLVMKAAERAGQFDATALQEIASQKGTVKKVASLAVNLFSGGVSGVGEDIYRVGQGIYGVLADPQGVEFQKFTEGVKKKGSELYDKGSKLHDKAKLYMR